MFANVQGKQKKQVRQLQCQERCIDYIAYYLSVVACTFFPTKNVRINTVKFQNKPLQIYAPQTLNAKNPPQIQIEQRKNCTVTHKFLHMQKNYYVCQVIAVKKCLLLFAQFTLQSWLGFPRSSRTKGDKVLEWLRFRKIYVLKASLSKNCKLLTNFLPNLSQRN